ncbi:MAG: alanine racemase [Anaerolineales bacterium]|nr:alanine racemase [Anaerolineales bacterium]
MNIYDQITKPTLLLDETIVRRNIARMAEKARRSGVVFRPHFKTHQSAEIGEWFREEGVTAITVSSVDMALYFAQHGWDDILIAFPVNLRQLAELNQLAEQVNLHLLLESVDAAERLSAGLRHAVAVWLKIDVGYHRTGLDWQDMAAVTAVARTVDTLPRLHLAGLLTHAGYRYQTGGAAEAQAVYGQMVNRMNAVRDGLRAVGLETAVSVGDTPTSSLVEQFTGVDEIRPGNFVFYDMMQVDLGACRPEDVAVAVACPIVAKHADRRQIVVYGGAIHLSKERLVTRDEQVNYGRIALPTASGWRILPPENYVATMSQEHGIIQADDALFDGAQIGGLLLVLPVHSCLTANLLKGYLTLDGRWIEMADIH